MKVDVYEQYRDALLCGLSAEQIAALDAADHDGFLTAVVTAGSLGWLAWTADSGIEPTVQGVEERERLGREVYSCAVCGSQALPVLMSATPEMLSVAWVCPDHDGRMQAIPPL